MRLHPASYAFASAVGIASGYYIFKPALEEHWEKRAAKEEDASDKKVGKREGRA